MSSKPRPKARATGSSNGPQKAKAKAAPDPVKSASTKQKPSKSAKAKASKKGWSPSPDHVLHPDKPQAKSEEAAADPQADGQPHAPKRFAKLDLMNLPTEVAEAEPMDDGRGKVTPTTDPKSLTKLMRRVEALNLRVAGNDYRVIHAELNKMGFKCSIKTVYYDVQIALRYISKYERVLAEDMRALQLRQCDALIAGLSDRAFNGDTYSVEAFLKVQERIAKLLGLDAPVQIDVNVRRPLHNATPEELMALMERFHQSRPLPGAQVMTQADKDRLLATTKPVPEPDAADDEADADEPAEVHDWVYDQPAADLQLQPATSAKPSANDDDEDEETDD